MSADRVIFVCIIVLAAVYSYATAQLPTLEIGDPLGPKAFPRLLGIGLLITAAMLFMEIRRERKTPPDQTSQAPGNRRHLVVITAVVAGTAAYLAVFTLLGYVIATSIYLLALMAYFHPGKWTANVLTSVIFCLLSYLMFSKLLGVTLPRGVLPF